MFYLVNEVSLEERALKIDKEFDSGLIGGSEYYTRMDCYKILGLELNGHRHSRMNNCKTDYFLENLLSI